MNTSSCQRWIRHQLTLLCIVTLCGCQNFTYGVDAINYGRNGVLLLQIGARHADSKHQYYSTVGVPFPIIKGLHPKIPTKYRDPTSVLGRFQGHDDTLPEEVEVVWQLADLQGCAEKIQIDPKSDADVEEVRRLGYDASAHVSKRHCKWIPLSDKIYRRTLDLRSIQGSNAYKKTGTRAQDVAGSRYTLNLTLIFIEDQVKVEVDNGATNPWL